MTQMHLIQDLGVIAGGVAFWFCFLWPLLIRPFWPWYRSDWGWNMAIKAELIAIALFPAILTTEFGIKPRIWLLWAEVLAIFAIPCVLAWRSWIIWRGQRRGGEDYRAEYGDTPAAERDPDTDTAA